MALTYDQITSVTREYILPGIKAQAYDVDPLLKILKKKGKITAKGGTKLQWPIRYAQLGHGGPVDPDDQQTFRRKETRTKAELDWKFYKTDSAISWSETTMNQGKEATVNLLEDKAVELKEDAQHMIAQAVWNLSTEYSSALDISPLDIAIDATATYGGVAYTDAATWISIEDSSSTTLTEQLLEVLRNQCIFAGHEPTHHFTTLNLVSKYHSIIDAAKQYEDKDTANMGIPHLTFYKRPVIGSSYATAAYWFGLDLDQIHLVPQSGQEFELTDWMDLTSQGYIKTKGAFLYWVGNLQVDMRRTSFKCSALDYTL